MYIAPKSDKAQKKSKLKKPMNSFMLFKKYNSAEIKQLCNTNSNTQVSKIASELWKNMSKQEKEPYQTESEELHRQHYLMKQALAIEENPTLIKQNIMSHEFTVVPKQDITHLRVNPSQGNPINTNLNNLQYPMNSMIQIPPPTQSCSQFFSAFDQNAWQFSETTDWNHHFGFSNQQAEENLFDQFTNLSPRVESPTLSEQSMDSMVPKHRNTTLRLDIPKKSSEIDLLSATFQIGAGVGSDLTWFNSGWTPTSAVFNAMRPTFF